MRLLTTLLRSFLQLRPLAFFFHQMDKPHPLCGNCRDATVQEEPKGGSTRPPAQSRLIQVLSHFCTVAAQTSGAWMSYNNEGALGSSGPPWVLGFLLNPLPLWKQARR